MKNAVISCLTFSIDLNDVEVEISEDPGDTAAEFIGATHGSCDNTCEVCHVSKHGWPLAALAIEYRTGDYSDHIDDLVEAVQTHCGCPGFGLEHWLSEWSDRAASQDYFECPECSECLYGQDREEYECGACGFTYEEDTCTECDSSYNAVGMGDDDRCTECGYKPSEHGEYV